jgi:diguanylate cyclase (GGDEF)-like protein
MSKKRRAAIIGPNTEIRQFLCDILQQEEFDTVGVETEEEVPAGVDLVISVLRAPSPPSMKKPGLMQQAFSVASEIVQKLGVDAPLHKLQELLSPSMLEEDLRKKNASLEHITQELKRANSELMRLAVTDSLTGLNNRRHFMEALRRECQRAQRYQRKLSLLILDIDHFKQINDTHGHPAGDAVLVGFAQLIAKSVRRTDLVARIGGEEFAIAYIETDIEKARVAAESLRLEVASAVFTHHQTPIQITLSGGLVEFPSEGIDNHLALLEEADKALYEAKTGGRDQISARGID